MKKGVILLLLIIGSISLSAQSIRLFHIERNKNDNIVCYDLNLKDNKIDKANPINIYWDNPKNTSGKKPELSSLERKMAYGITVNSVSDNSVIFIMKAYKDRPITVIYNSETKTAVPSIVINNKKAKLDKLYIFASAPLYTSVVYVELFGQVLNTGEILKERINNK